MDYVVTATYTVNTPETLNDAHGIPMDVVVDEVVAILQVLSLADAVGGNQHIYLVRDVRIDGCLFLRYGREQSQHLVEVQLLTLGQPQGTASLHITRDQSGVQTVPFLYGLCQAVVQILCGVREGGEDDNLLVIAVYRVGKLTTNVGYKLL